jgi:hypothetical protein
MDFIPASGSWTNLNITIPAENGNADNINDTNTLSDLLYTKFILPKKLNDNSNIPNGLIIILNSRKWKRSNWWETRPDDKRIAFQWNQSANNNIGDREAITSTTTWAGTLDNLQSIDSNWNLLSTQSYDMLPKTSMNAYPNPTSENITIDNNDNISESFVYDLYDITGKKIWWSVSIEWQEIQLPPQTTGQIIIDGKTEDNKRFTNKIIKK